MDYTTGERVFIVEKYLQSKSFKSCQAKFIAKYGRFYGNTAPHKSTILRLIKKFRLTGSVLDAKRSGRPSKMTEAVTRDIAARLTRNPTISLRRLSQKSNQSVSLCRKVAKYKLKMLPYRVSCYQELKNADYNKRVAYCNWFNIFKTTLNVLDKTFFTDEAWFYLNGYVCSQNNRHWATHNPHDFVEKPLHPIKVGVWTAISKKRIIGPIFFQETVNTDRYLAIFDQFVQRLTADEQNNGYYQQDGATCHTSNRSMNRIRAVFGNRLISKPLWPARSPDLTPNDFYLWGALKNKVYNNHPTTLTDLETNIQNEINKITEAELISVFKNMERRVDLCLQNDGGHFQHLL